MNGQQLERIYLTQGEIFFSNKPSVVTTILGSCVSVTFFNPKLHYAGINHGMFPEYKNNRQDNPLLYVDYSIKKLADLFAQEGIIKKDIEVKLFGGGAVIETQNAGDGVGEKNALSAIKTLESLGFNIKAINVGDDYARKLFFHTDTGEIFLKRICTFDKTYCKK